MLRASTEIADLLFGGRTYLWIASIRTDVMSEKGKTPFFEIMLALTEQVWSQLLGSNCHPFF